MPEQQDFDADYLQAVAELEAIKAFTAEKVLAREKADEAKNQRTALLERWERAGFGDTPLPDSLEGAPLHVQMKLAATDPQLARELGMTTALPAGTELRLGRGLDFLQPEDVPVLERAGHHEVVAQLRQRHQEQMWATFEASHAAVVDPERRAAEQAEAEQRRLQSEAAANYQARSQWLGATHSGTRNPLVAEAVRLGQLQPGARQ